MARSDAELLNTPSIDAMLEEARREAERAGQRQREADERRAEASLTHCPHCRTRLSPIDAKMGNCLSCSKPLFTQKTEAIGAAPGPAPFIVRI